MLEIQVLVDLVWAGDSPATQRAHSAGAAIWEALSATDYLLQGESEIAHLIWTVLLSKPPHPCGNMSISLVL